MGVKAKTVTGARAKLYINRRLAGIFTSVSYEVNYGVTPIYILGRYNAAELVYTDMDVITMSVSGFRVLGNGPFNIGSVPQLQDLLQHEDIDVQLIDRQETDPTKNLIATILNVRPLGFSSASSSRGVQDLNVRLQGTVFGDEAGTQDDVGATTYG
jgi:hypothetical protein